jgi:hypothetical protein
MADILGKMPPTACTLLYMTLHLSLFIGIAVLGKVAWAAVLASYQEQAACTVIGVGCLGFWRLVSVGLLGRAD